MTRFLLFLIAAIAPFLVLGQQGAEDSKAFKHPLTDMPGAAEDVETTFFFPSQSDLKFPIGEVIHSLCHFSNKGSSKYNISAIMGSLNAPFDFSHHFQNYSYKPFGIVVKNDEEITLKYTFQLHPELEPVDYQLAVTVFYESETESFSTTFFNQTVELYSPVSEYDFETISSVLTSLVFTVFVILLTVFACFPDLKFSQALGKKLKKFLPSDNETVEEPEMVDNNNDSWTEVTNKKKSKKAAARNQQEE